MACSCWDNQRPIDRGPATAANQPTAAGTGVHYGWPNWPLDVGSRDDRRSDIHEWADEPECPRNCAISDDQMRDAVGERVRLSRAGPGDHEEWGRGRARLLPHAMFDASSLVGIDFSR